METDLEPTYMVKHAQDDDSIEVNRTIKVKGEIDGTCVVLVEDRDYLDDRTGQTRTIVFREKRDSIEVAKAEAQKWITASLADGFIDNPWSTGKIPPI